MAPGSQQQAPARIPASWKLTRRHGGRRFPRRPRGRLPWARSPQWPSRPTSAAGSRLVLLPTLVFVGLVTFDRVLQSGIEDFGYAHRIARFRGFYFQYAPGPVDHLASVPPEQRLRLQGLPGGRRWQRFLTVAGMVSVVTAVLAGSAAGLGAAVAVHHQLAAALAANWWSPSRSWSGCCASRPRPGTRSARYGCSTTSSPFPARHGRAWSLAAFRPAVPTVRWVDCRAVMRRAAPAGEGGTPGARTRRRPTGWWPRRCGGRPASCRRAAPPTWRRARSWPGGR
jgi:hypothetical protein